jgi:hypothetical protein
MLESPSDWYLADNVISPREPRQQHPLLLSASAI